MRYIVYAVTDNNRLMTVRNSRFGEWNARQMACKVHGDYKILQVLPNADELGICELKWIASFLKGNVELGNSKSEQKLARRLFMWEPTKRKGNTKNLKPKKDKVDKEMEDMPVDQEHNEYDSIA